MIMPGVHIGEGAVIASGSIVTKNVEPYSVVAGNPAKQVKKRFNDDVIQQLIDLKIYDLEFEKFQRLIPHLVQSDISALQTAYAQLMSE